MQTGRKTVGTRAAAILLLGGALLWAAPGSAQDKPDTTGGTGLEATPDDGGGQDAHKTRSQAGRQEVPLQPGSTLPPKNLKKVGDHWTPYDPPDPESFSPDATLHIIVPGDTLWDLADLVFGNPYLWPQIWNENRYIQDSHWIYPGDPLLLPARPTVVGEIVPQGQEGAPAAAPQAEKPAPAPDAGAGEEEESTPVPTAETPATGIPPVGPPPAKAHAPRNIPKILPLADDYDMRCSGYIAPREEKPDYFISNQAEEGKLGLTEGDVIYLNRGKSNGHVEPGTEYSIIERETEVHHPMSHKFLGYYFRRLGTVKVLAAQETTAIAVISMACDEIRTGHALVPLYVTVLPAKMAPPFDPITVISEDQQTGYIVHMKDNQKRGSQGQLVDIDMGYDDGLKPGDFFTVYLPSEPFNKFPKTNYNYTYDGNRFTKPKIWKDSGNNLPPVKVIGQLVVLFAEKNTATAKILHATREIEVGDSVVPQ